MTKLIMMQGLPASGKSTIAEKMVLEEGYARVNKDLLRKMLHCGKWNYKNEDITFEVEQAIARDLLAQGKDVVVDDTNFGLDEAWMRVADKAGATFGKTVFDVPVAECIRRDEKRGKDSVGVDVIMRMALQFSYYPKPAKGFVLCDMDGTLADITHRLEYVKTEPKKWDTFFALTRLDAVRQEVVDQVVAKQEEGYEVIILSARPERLREVTREWLNLFCPKIKFKTLIMRREGDKRPDTMVKQQMYDKLFKDKYDIHCIFDDRPSVIRMWRENGLEVIDVGGGIEF